MSEKEYIKLIPDDELSRVRKLLAKIYRLRGWQTLPHLLDVAWERVLSAAKTPAGGGWTDFFSLSDLDPARLGKLLTVIDNTLLGGCLKQQLRSRRQGELRFMVVDKSTGNDDWICYFDDRNVIFMLRSKWAQDVSEGHPMSCEGVLCTTRLQVLVHTIAHELVHALVFHYFPDIDATSVAYLPDDRHGPIFKLLNKRLFGHSCDSYNHIFGQPPKQQTSS